jgi:hypothetical protein
MMWIWLILILLIVAAILAMIGLWIRKDCKSCNKRRDDFEATASLPNTCMCGPPIMNIYSDDKPLKKSREDKKEDGSR